MESDSDVPTAGSARRQRPLAASKPAESPALAARARRPAGGSSGSESELDLVSAAKAFRRPSQEQRPSPAKQAEPEHAAARQGGGAHRGEARRASAGRASPPVQGEADSDSDSGFDLIRAARAQHSHAPSSPPAPAAASSPSSNAAAAHGRTASAAAGRGSTRHAATASLGSAPAPVPASSRYSRSELGRPARQHSPSAQAAAAAPSSLPAPHPAEAAAGLVEPGVLKASGSTPQLHGAIPHAEGRPEVQPGVVPQSSAQELQPQSSALLQVSLSRITVAAAPEPSSEAFNALHVNPVFLEDILAAEVGLPAAAYVELSWACTPACLHSANRRGHTTTASVLPCRRRRQLQLGHCLWRHLPPPASTARAGWPRQAARLRQWVQLRGSPPTGPVAATWFPRLAPPPLAASLQRNRSRQTAPSTGRLSAAAAPLPP